MVRLILLRGQEIPGKIEDRRSGAFTFKETADTLSFCRLNQPWFTSSSLLGV